MPIFLLFMLSLGAAQRNTEWYYRGEAVNLNSRGCANLTLVLGNWKYAIMTQVKDLLLNDHSTVLPDYGRIKSLSEALSDLYKEFDSLKGSLAELTANFDKVESFVDDVREERPRRKEINTVAFKADNLPRRKTRVLIRRVLKAGHP